MTLPTKRLMERPKCSLTVRGVEGRPNRTLGIHVRPPVIVTHEQTAAVRAGKDQHGSR